MAQVRKAQAELFMAIIIGLMLLFALVIISGEKVTGIKVGELIVKNAADSITNKINLAVLAPGEAVLRATCPAGYNIEINNGRVTVKAQKLFKERVINSYYIVPKNMVLPQNKRMYCNSTNFVLIEKWLWENGTKQLSVTTADDYKYTVKGAILNEP